MTIQSIVNQIVKEAVADAYDKRSDIEKILDVLSQVTFLINRSFKLMSEDKGGGD